MPVLFRLLYCCGLRASEAATLKGGDVDLEKGVLTIRNSKFGKTRYVPMSGQITARCAEYDRTRLADKGGDDWFFAAPDGGHIWGSIFKAGIKNAPPTIIITQPNGGFLWVRKRIK